MFLLFNRLCAEYFLYCGSDVKFTIKCAVRFLSTYHYNDASKVMHPFDLGPYDKEIMSKSYYWIYYTATIGKGEQVWQWERWKEETTLKVF